MSKIRQNKQWNSEEQVYLMESWGTKSIPTISRTLKRTPNAVIIKAQKLGLGAFLDSGDYVTLNQLATVVTGRKYNQASGYILKSWVEERGLPVKTKRVKNCSFRVVYIHDFWKWAKKNRSFIDFSKMEKHSLGAEPDWMQDQRKLDQERNELQKISPWTKAEDKMLIDLLNEYRYSYLELSKRLKRSGGAIQRRICDLGLMQRPVKAYNHNKYTSEEKFNIEKMLLDGLSYIQMAEILDRSDKALRGYIYRTYGSEKLDVARKRIKGDTK